MSESAYPAGLDDLHTDAEDRSDLLTGELHPDQVAGAGFHAELHNVANAAIIAIEQTLGIEPQGDEDDLVARLGAIESALGEKQDAADAAADGATLTAAINKKQDAASAATDAELAVEAKARSDADSAEEASRKVADAALTATATAAQASADAAGSAVTAEEGRAKAKEAELQSEIGTLENLVTGAPLVFKGVIDCSGNPKYPAAEPGHTYIVSVAGKIGGASGESVEPGDALICAIEAAEGTQGAVGSKWVVLKSATTANALVKGERERAEGVEAGKQPLAEALTSLATTAPGTFGKALLEAITAAKARESLELGSAAVLSSEDFDPSGRAEEEQIRAEEAEAGLVPTTRKVAGHALSGDVTVSKGDVGLGSVDNTSDATKNSAAVTLTNHRVTPRITSITSSAEPEIKTDELDQFNITALATAITSMTAKLKGTPADGQKLIVRILDNGTARAITWGASFVSRSATLPTTTIAGKYLYLGFVYNSVAAKWDCVAVGYGF